jgi:hypothetical protein
MTLQELANKVNELLKTVPGDAIVCGEAGEATVAEIDEVKDGWMHRWKSHDTYGMSDFEHTDNLKDVPSRDRKQAVRAVYIG